MNIDERQILNYWNEWNLPDHLPVTLARELNIEDIKRLKDVKNRSIWRIEAPIEDGHFPIILKLCNGPDNRQRESILYSGLKETNVSQYMPDIYLIREGEPDHGMVMFMECLEVISEKSDLVPEDLYKIVPVLAGLHASTFQHQSVSEQIQWVIPSYLSGLRVKKHEECKTDFKKAMNIPSIREVMKENCPELPQLLDLNLDFPEIIDSGFCLTHSDLTLNNIGYKEKDGELTIKFIDYGAATYAPCWLDLVKLLESPLDHRPQWDEEAIRRDVVAIYVEEMKKQGITFAGEPLYLYKLAYMMRVFENEFRRNLHLSLKRGGQVRRVFPRILSKISKFSHELGLLNTESGQS